MTNILEVEISQSLYCYGQERNFAHNFCSKLAKKLPVLEHRPVANLWATVEDVVKHALINYFMNEFNSAWKSY